jgi:hypothetical protein
VGFDEYNQLIGEESFVEHYGNPMASVSKNTTTYVVEREDDKLRVSVYRFYKRRYVGNKFFGVERQREYLTYNLKTKNFYRTISYKPIGGRQYRSVRTNQFENIQQSINQLPVEVKDYVSKYLVRVYGLGLSDNLGGSVIDAVIKDNGIKGPNHLRDLMVNYYPGKKYLKKNGGNAVLAIMDSVGMRGGFYRKVINNNPDLDMFTFVNTFNLVGDYVKMIPKEYFTGRKSFMVSHFYAGDTVTDDMGYKVKLKIAKIIIDNHNSNLVTNISGIIRDHIRVVRELLEYDTKYKFKASDVNTLLLEHSNYSEALKDYKRGFVYTYLYDKEMVDAVQINERLVRSKLLSNSTDYNNESSRQSNCVSTYIGKRRTFIISLDINGYIITMEFDYSGKCVQKRARFNRSIDSQYDDVVERQESLVLLAKEKGLLVKPSLMRENIINGSKGLITPEEEVTGVEDFDFFDDFLF